MKVGMQPGGSQDRRASDRVSAQLEGKLFVPGEERTVDCTISNLSVGGAGIICAEPPPVDAFVVLYVKGFGRFDGVTTHSSDGELGLKFVCKEAKRKRLEQDLEVFVREGMSGVAHLHQDRTASARINSFTCADGTKAFCSLVDISLDSATLKTLARPAIGEEILLGHTRAWVVRHHTQGIDIQFHELTEADHDR
ncbi:MAG TPA: PilZ domain-containing protein [Rhizomicrobium sp.]|nr:PilZ domain-containing protein [Rhizomicrobium sp.]